MQAIKTMRKFTDRTTYIIAQTICGKHGTL